MKKLLALTAFCFAFSVMLRAQPVSKAGENTRTSKEVMDGFMDKRLGMFIHWGPVTLRGTEIGWSRNHQVAQEDYDILYKEFNPVLFNAEDWVKTAKDAGMKYLTITAKHHDGFCLWPTSYTDYNIMHSQYKKDIVGALAKACKKYDIKFCIYYTVLDWYSPDYPLHNDGNKEADPGADMDKFVKYMKNQLKELITNYHPYMLWFDGNWEKPWTREMGVDIYNYIKKLDPAVIVNNRLGKGNHKTLTAETVGDYATPEQEIGGINMQDPWESCITLCNQWAWKPNDKMKSLKQCIQTLASTAGGNGNLLLNVGPMLDGRIEDRQTERLKELGDWLKVYGEAIYKTMGGPYKPDSIYAATRKGNKVYLLVFKKESNQLIIPAIPGVKLKKAFFMDGGQVSFKQDEKTVILGLPEKLPDDNCSVIVLEMDKNVEDVAILDK